MKWLEMAILLITALMVGVIIGGVIERNRCAAFIEGRR